MLIVGFWELLGLQSVDAGHGWLIFVIPPAEVAVHPAEAPGVELYPDVLTTSALKSNHSARVVWRVRQSRKRALPGGGTIGLYQPKHPLAIVRQG